MPDETRYKRLNRELVVSMVLVSVTPLLLVFGIIGFEFHTSYHAKVFEHLRVVVEKHGQIVDEFLNERLAEVRILAETVPAGQLGDSAGLAEVLASLQTHHGGIFVDLGVVGADGIQKAYAGPFKLHGADYSQAPWFAEVRRRGSYISDVFLGLRGIPHFIVAVRLGQGEGSRIVRATIDFVAFGLLVQNMGIGRTGSAFIVNTQGEFQTGPSDELRAELPGLLPKIQAWFLEDGRGGARGDAPGVNVAVDYSPVRERDVLLVARPLKSGEWILVFRQDEDEAFASLHTTRNLGLLVVFLGCLAIAAMAQWRAGRLTSRLRQADEDKEMLGKQVIEAGKLATVGELAAGIAHEINNPVAIMVEEGGWVADLMGGDGPLNDEDRAEVARALEQIRTQGRRCRDITHKLLSFARRTDSVPRSVDLNACLLEMADLSRQRARIAGVEIVTELAPDLPGISASPSEIQQVLLNLINNAVDAMEHDGGTLTLTSFSEGGVVHVDVRDQGQGIPSEHLGRIFDPFFTTKPVGKGTGLGLSICYGIVTKMGGDLSVQSAPGKGTLFTVKLPATGAAKEPGDEEHESDAAALGDGDANETSGGTT